MHLIRAKTHSDARLCRFMRLRTSASAKTRMSVSERETGRVREFPMSLENDDCNRYNRFRIFKALLPLAPLKLLSSFYQIKELVRYMYVCIHTYISGNVC